MLDFFLVLGQIPGTNLVITFSELLVLAALFVVAACLVLKPEAKEYIRPTVWDSLVRYELPTLPLPFAQTGPNQPSQSIDAWRAWISRHWRITH